jgi:hypothetical protein
MVTYGDGGVIDPAKFLDYIAKQFPTDLANLVNARDELAKRQGALSAVEKANKDREKAAKVLEAATAEAATIVADAQKVADANAAKKAELYALETELVADRKAFAAETVAKTADLMTREQQVASREAAVAALQAEYASKLQALDADRAALNARVKAFQDKVAALSA